MTTRALILARESRYRFERDPLQHIRWLPAQRALLECPDRRRLLRAGNQAQGKSTAGLANALFHALGRHPFYDVPSAPTEGWVCCASWSQSLSIQQKLWDLTPKSEVHPACEFDPVKGFRGRYPALQLRNGSRIWIKTTGQGGLRLAGATLDWAMFDEPPVSARIYSEVTKRVMRTNGWIWSTLTPVNAPVDWLQEMAGDARITDLHFRLTPENLIPTGQTRPMVLGDGTVCGAEWIDSIIADTMPHEVPVVCHGEWEFRSTGALFSRFRATEHVSEDMPSGSPSLRLAVDHGSGADFSSVALLVAVDADGVAWVVDEVVSDGETTEDDDARAILEMLGNNGLKWKDLNQVYGDRPWYGRGAAKLGRKSNGDLARALERRQKLRPGALRPAFQTVKRGKGAGRGSVHLGCRYLHRAMVSNRFRVHPRCERTIESIEKWDFTDNEWKHCVDTLRYAVNDLVLKTRRPGAPVVHLY